METTVMGYIGFRKAVTWIVSVAIARGIVITVTTRNFIAVVTVLVRRREIVRSSLRCSATHLSFPELSLKPQILHSKPKAPNPNPLSKDFFWSLSEKYLVA